MRFYFSQLSLQIDWNHPPRFLDKELAQAGFADTPSGRVADKLVAVVLLDGSERWILVHVEVQAQRDDALARRVLDYNYRIFDQHKRSVASLVVLADDDPDWRPDSFHTDVLGTRMGITFATAKLLDCANRTDELEVSRNPFALVTLAHLHTQQTCHSSAERYAAKWQLTKLLLQRGWSKKRIMILFKVINWMMTLPEPLQLRYRRAVSRLERSGQMEWIDPYDQIRLERLRQKVLKQGRKEGREEGREQGREEGREQGREEGREQGREEGREQGAAIVLERQLARRFGPLPQTVRKKLATASMAQLSAWSEAILDAQSLRQVFK